MSEELYKVTVSSLEVRKQVSKSSRVYLMRDTIVKVIGKSKQYRKQMWIEVATLAEPTVVGFVQQKYLSKI